MKWARDIEWEQAVEEQARQRGVPLPHFAGAGPGFRCHRAGLLAAIVSRDDYGDGPRWHVSVSHDNRIPNWEELVDAAHDLRPGVPFVVGIPPRSWWMNVHPRVLHLVELHDEALVQQWRHEGLGQTPT